jgi:hypothetical protein
LYIHDLLCNIAVDGFALLIHDKSSLLVFGMTCLSERLSQTTSGVMVLTYQLAFTTASYCFLHQDACCIMADTAGTPKLLLFLL